MSGQGIVRETPIIFNTAFVGLSKCTIITHGSCDLFDVNSKFIPSKPCLRRSLLLISMLFGSEASMNIFSLEKRSLDIKNSEILQNFQFKSRKYPQPAVRIHNIKIYSVLIAVCVLVFVLVLVLEYWTYSRIRSRTRTFGVQDTEDILLRTALDAQPGKESLRMLSHKCGRSRTISQTLGQQFSKIIGRKKLIGNIYFTVKLLR